MALHNSHLIKKLEEHIKKNPSSHSFCPLAQIYYENGKWDKAEQIILKGLKNSPSYAPAYILLGKVYRKQNQVEKALDHLNKAKELQPDNANIYRSLAEIYKQQNDMENTLKAYQMLVSLNPEDKTSLKNVQLIEKMMRNPKNKSPSSNKESLKSKNVASNKTLLTKERKKLVKLQQILARVENFINP